MMPFKATGPKENTSRAKEKLGASKIEFEKESNN
jgi:hypothetical protein